MSDLLPRRLQNALHQWRGCRTVRLGSHSVRVLPYDRQFWDSVDAGKWEPETLDALADVIQRGGNHCDIGAWIGPTVLFAHHQGAHVTCFEPDPLAYERLLGNLRLNGAFEVRAFPCALGKSDGLRTMGAMVGSLGKSATSLFGTKAAQTVQVAGMTWQTASKLLELPVFHTFKMDIEGGEVELLPLMMEYFREHRPAILLSTHWSFLSENDRQSLASSLSDLGSIYRSVTALGRGKASHVDLTDPETASRQSVFLLKP